MEPLFQPLPEDLSTLSDDDLQALLDAYRETARQVFDKDDKVTGGMTPAQIAQHAREGTELIQTVRGEQAQRVEQAEAAEAELAELRAAAGVDDTDEDGEETPAADEPDAAPAEVETPPAAPAEEEDEPDAEAVEEDVEEAIAAAGRTAHPQGRAKPKAPAARANLRPVSRPFLVEGVGGVGIGRQVDALEIREAMTSVVDSIIGSTGRRENIKVAKFRSDKPDAFTLSDRDTGQGNGTKIKAAIEMRRQGYDKADLPIAASGALCAPVAPYYELEMLSVADRPVRDALVSFNAARGGIQYATPFDLSAVTTGVGIITAAAAASGGTGAVKNCQAVTCPSFNTVKVDSIYSCLSFDNLNARAFPEFVDAANAAAAAQWARTADAHLLDGIRSHCTAVTSAFQLNAVRDYLKLLLVAAAGYRSRHRMPADARLSALAPQWLPDLLLVDVFGHVQDWSDFDRDSIIALAERANVSLTFYMDTSANATVSQVFGTQNAGALLDFPGASTHGTVETFLFSPGSFLHVDSGDLDLGIVRDSTLNSTNDYRVFMESWENVAYTGTEALVITSTLCDLGASAAGVALTCS